jgi:hypothetical protein
MIFFHSTGKLLGAYLKYDMTNFQMFLSDLRTIFSFCSELWESENSDYDLVTDQSHQLGRQPRRSPSQNSNCNEKIANNIYNFSSDLPVNT